jgi:hypothetical protein
MTMRVRVGFSRRIIRTVLVLVEGQRLMQEHDGNNRAKKSGAVEK